MTEKNTVSTQSANDTELTNWQKIDRMEAELSSKKPKKKRRGGMKFRRIFGDTVGQTAIMGVLIDFSLVVFDCFLADCDFEIDFFSFLDNFDF